MRIGELDARAQLVIPSPAPVSYAVVIVGGGLVGHAAFTLDVWRATCARLHCALIHFDVSSAVRPPTRAEDPCRNAAVGSGDALLALIDTLSRKSGRPELARSKLALFGFSATGSFVVTFGALHPQRTLTAVRYHSHLRGLDVDTVALTRVPMLALVSVDDSVAGVDDSQTLWKRGRRVGAPWALTVEAGRSHVSLDSWYWASDLIFRWIEGVGRTAASTPNPWFGEIATGAIGRIEPGSPMDGASWLPDSVSAESWRRLHRGKP